MVVANAEGMGWGLGRDWGPDWEALAEKGCEGKGIELDWTRPQGRGRGDATRGEKLKEEEEEEEAAIYYRVFFFFLFIYNLFWFWCGKEAGKAKN